MGAMKQYATPDKPSATDIYQEREDFRRFLNRILENTGIILRTHYREVSHTVTKVNANGDEYQEKVYHGEPKPIMVPNPNAASGPLKVREPEKDRGKMEKELTTRGR